MTGIGSRDDTKKLWFWIVQYIIGILKRLKMIYSRFQPQIKPIMIIDSGRIWWGERIFDDMSNNIWSQFYFIDRNSNFFRNLAAASILQSQRLVWIPCKFLLQDKFSCTNYISIEVLIKRCNLQPFGRLRELLAFDPVEYRPQKKSADTLSSREWTTQRMSSISFLLFSRATRIWFVRRLRCITLHLQRGIKEVPREQWCLISNQR